MNCNLCDLYILFFSCFICGFVDIMSFVARVRSLFALCIIILLLTATDMTLCRWRMLDQMIKFVAARDGYGGPGLNARELQSSEATTTSQSEQQKRKNVMNPLSKDTFLQSV